MEWGRLTRAARAARVAQAREDASAFVDGLYGVEGAGFQRAWHAAVERESRLVLWAPVEHGKTQRMMGHTIWRLGRHPHMHGLVVGESATAAEKLLASIRRTIDESPWVREVFPHLKPAAGKYAKWTDQAIRIEGQKPGDKDYSLQAIGIGGAILGARLDWVLGDDLCTFHTTATSLQRQKVREWWTSTITGRLLPGAHALILGNAWFPDDVMHWLVKEAGYASSKVEAYRTAGDGSVIEASILWPAQWSKARLEARIKELGPGVEADRQMRCIPYASGSNQFDLEWFDRAFAMGEALWGTAFGRLVPRFLAEYRGAWPVYTGVDLGVSRKESADLTSIFTLAVEPETQRRYVIHVDRGRWKGPDIVRRLEAVYARYGGQIVVENNAAQEYLAEWTRSKGVPITSFFTGGQKSDPRFGVPSIAQELEMGLWVLPTEPAMHAWRSDCLSYTPGQHVGDTLMASWLAREAARASGVGSAAIVHPGGVRASTTLHARYDQGGRRGSGRPS